MNASAVEPGQITRTQVLRLIHQEHPRILATKRDFVMLSQRARRDEHVAAWIEQIQERADKILKKPAVSHELPDGKRLLAVSRQLVQRVYDLALTFRLTADRRYLKGVWREIKTAAAFPDWNPSHFLDTAEMAHGFAIAFDWLHDQWSEEHKAIFCDAVQRHAFVPGLEPDMGRGMQNWWHRCDNNWNEVCNGGLGIAALAMFEEMPDLATQVLQNAVQNMPASLQHFAPDGGWAEGPAYWGYTMQYLVNFLAACDTALDTDFGLSDLPGLDKTATFFLHCTGPTGRPFNFADGADHRLHSAQLHWLAQRYELPGVVSEHAARTARPHALDVLWYEPAEESAPLELDACFRGVEAVCMRSAWNDPSASFFALQCGRNAVGHNQLDFGSFIFEALGVRWLMDFPSEDYNLPGFFGGQRFDYYRVRAEGHNVPVINPSEDGGQDPDAAGHITQFEPGGESPSMTADLTSAYPDAAQVQRHARLEARRDLVLRDDIELREPGEIWWFAHTRAAISVGDDGCVATLTHKDKRLAAELLSPQGARWQAMDARPLPTSPDPEGQNPNDGSKPSRNDARQGQQPGPPGTYPAEAARKLAIHLEGVERATVEVRFRPLD